MNLLELSNIVNSKAASVAFLQQRGVLHNPRNCGTCGNPVTLDLRDKGDRWRCALRGCRKEVGLRKDT